MEGKLLYFMGKNCTYVSGKLEYKLQAAVPVLCWYFFNLVVKTVVKKRNIFSFLIAKICMVISLYQQLLVRVCSAKWDEHV